MSVSAYFSDAQCKVTKLAGELVGLKVERLINEPIAMALAYGSDDFDRQAETPFLIVDPGDGTFEVSILEHCFTLSWDEKRDMIGQWATMFEALLDKLSYSGNRLLRSWVANATLNMKGLTTLVND